MDVTINLKSPLCVGRTFKFHSLSRFQYDNALLTRVTLGFQNLLILPHSVPLNNVSPFLPQPWEAPLYSLLLGSDSKTPHRREILQHLSFRV